MRHLPRSRRGTLLAGAREEPRRVQARVCSRRSRFELDAAVTRFFENGRAAACGGSLLVESAESAAKAKCGKCGQPLLAGAPDVSTGGFAACLATLDPADLEQRRAIGDLSAEQIGTAAIVVPAMTRLSRSTLTMA